MRSTSGSRTSGSKGEREARSPTRPAPLIAIPIDNIADAALAAKRDEAVPVVRCDLCGGHVDNDEPGGRGLYVWSRGDERRYEEPGLCERCATVLGISALQQWSREDEEDE